MFPSLFGIYCDVNATENSARIGKQTSVAQWNLGIGSISRIGRTSYTLAVWYVKAKR